jgi:hypothetical protein
MFRSSTSNSENVGWRRVGREVLRVGLVLLALEMIVRIGPIHALLAERLGPYENLLWYDARMPRYKNQLSADPNYTVWMLGSSPMMTAWKPSLIQSEVREAGHEDFTVQNYGLTTLLNLGVMAQAVDRWMLEMDQPQYVVLGISQLNFSIGASWRARIENSPLESVLIYPDNIDDYANGFLYETSVLFHYLILARNAMNIPIQRMQRLPGEQGGYSERKGVLISVETDLPVSQRGVIQEHLQTNLMWLDQMIDMLQAHHLPVLVVSLPISDCQMQEQYGSMEAYQQRYLEPVSDHLRQRGISLVEMDTWFYERIAPGERDAYFDDGTHMNRDGAAMMSEQLSQILGDWISSM